MATYIFSLLLATLIFYGGAGVNLVSYCCGDCRSEGISVVLVDKCCEIHDHHHAEEAHTHQHLPGEPCTGHEHDCGTDCCQLERVDFEWDNTSSSVQQPMPVEIDLLSAALPTALLLTFTDKDTELYREDHAPPHVICPRVYLSLLTTLLI